MSKARRKKLHFSARICIYGIVLMLFYLPVLIVLAKAFLARDALAALKQFVATRLFFNTLLFSCQEAFLSALFSVLMALPGAYFFGRYNFPGKRLMRSFMVLPFMLPGILVVLAMIIFYGNNGVFNHLLAGTGLRFSGLYGFWGIVLANVFYNFTFCLRILSESWQRIDPKLVEASKLLGAGFSRTWIRITLPLLMPTIAYLFALVFLYAFLSFTIVLVLGGYLYKTFEVLIYIEYNQKLNFNRATVIAAIQTVILAMFLYLQNLFNKNVPHLGNFTADLPKLSFRRQPLGGSIFLGYIIFVAFFLISPFVAVLSRSFNTSSTLGTTFNFSNYSLLFSDGFNFAVGKSFSCVLGISLAMALMVAIITVAAAYWFARDRSEDRSEGRHKLSLKNMDPWFQLPLGISFLTFAFGLFILGGGYLPVWVLIIWAQFFMIFPLIYSILKTARGDLAGSLLEAAATLGAGAKTIFWTVEFPLMKKAIVTAITYAMALSMGDLTAVLVLGQGDFVTIPLAMYRLIGHYRFAQATALGSIYLFIAFVLFAVFEAVEGKSTKIRRAQ
jgi:ABC-type Fe3+ transport system, permease component